MASLANLNGTFLKTDQFELLGEVPNGPLAHNYFPGASPAGGKDGTLVRVRPLNGQPWIGTFAFGPGGISGIFSMPGPELVCVVSRGAGYIVNAAAPTRSEVIQPHGIQDARIIPERQLIVFATLNDLFAYGPAGLTWMTHHLAWDELKIADITQTTIEAAFWDAANNSPGVVAVSLADGRHEPTSSSRLNKRAAGWRRLPFRFRLGKSRR